MNRTAVFIQKAGKACRISRLYPLYIICVGIQLHRIIMDASRANRLQLAVTKIKNIFQPGGVTYGKLLRQISKQYE